MSELDTPATPPAAGEYPGRDPLKARALLSLLPLLLACATKAPPARSGGPAPFAWEQLSWEEGDAPIPLSVDAMVLAADAADQLALAQRLPVEWGAELILGRSTGGWEGERCAPIAVAAEGLGRCRALPLEAGPSSPVWLHAPGSSQAVLPVMGGSADELTLVCHPTLRLGADSEIGYRAVAMRADAAAWVSPLDCPNTPAIKLARSKMGAAWVRWAGLDADTPLPQVRALKEAPPSEALLYKPERRWRAYQGTDEAGRGYAGFHDEVSGARVVLPQDPSDAPFRFDLDGSGVFELVHQRGADGAWVASYDGDEDGVVDSCWEDWKTGVAQDRRRTVQTFPAQITLATGGRCGPGPQP